MRDPIQQLMEEHRVIEQVLAALEAAARRELQFPFYEQAVDFIVNFADGCHHAKEEDRLFPMGRSHLDADELRILRARFDEVSDGGGTERKYTDLANVLCEQAGI